jgi:hypothetical protein
MKKIVFCMIVSSLLAASSAMAANLKQLRNNERLDIEAPSYLLFAKGADRAITASVLDLCREGEYVRYSRPVSICTKEVKDYSKRDYPYSAAVCVEKVTVTPEAPIQTFNTVCTKTEFKPNASGYMVPVCVKSEQRPARIPMTHTVKVTEYSPSKSYYARSAVRSWTESFEIPSCRR